MCVCVVLGVEGPHTTKQFFDISSVSYSPTQFWHYLPVDSNRLRAQSHKATSTQIINLGHNLCFWPIGYKPEVPKTSPHFGFD